MECPTILLALCNSWVVPTTPKSFYMFKCKSYQNKNQDSFRFNASLNKT